MKENRCQNNVKTSKNGMRRSPSGSKRKRLMSSNEQTYFFTQEHGRNHTTTPDARRSLTVPLKGKVGKDRHTTTESKPTPHCTDTQQHREQTTPHCTDTTTW